MGVHKLWDVIHGTGFHDIEESLRGKRIAIDISIWLNRFVKILQDRKDRAKSLIIGMFIRCCKLLFYQIKPIFVFDGGFPQIKLQTIIKRRKSKTLSQGKLQDTARKLFITRLEQLSKKNSPNTKEWLQSVQEEIDNIMGTNEENTQINIKDNTNEEDSENSLSSSESEELDFENWFSNESESNSDSNSNNSTMDSINIINSTSQDIINSSQIELPELKIHDSLSTINTDDLYIENGEEIDIDVFRELPDHMKHQIVSKLEQKRKDITALTPSPSSNLIRGCSFSPSKFKSSESVINASPSQFSQLQLQSILQKGKTVQKITQMKDVIQNEGWRSVSSRSGEYQILLGSNTPITKDSVFGQGETTPLSSTSYNSSIPSCDSKRETPLSIMFPSDSESDSSELSLSDFSNDEPLLKSFDILPNKSLPTVNDTTSTHQRLENDSLTLENDSLTQFTENSDDSNGEMAIPDSMSLESKTKAIPPSKIILFNDNSDSSDIEIMDTNSSSIVSTNIIQQNYNENMSTSEDDIIITNNNNEIIELSNENSIEILNDNTIQDNSIQSNNIQDDNSIIQSSNKTNEPKIKVTRTTNKPQINRNTSLFNIFSTNNKSQTSLTHNNALEAASIQLENEATILSKKARQQTVQIESVTRQMINETQELLSLFGIPFIISPSEAEAQCAELQKLGLVDAIVTEDSDVFLFGGECVYKNLFNQNKNIEKFTIKDITNDLGLSRNSLIDYALLVGSDYTEGIKGIGTVLALEILGEFKTLSNFSTWIKETNEIEKDHTTLQKKLLRMKNNGKLNIQDHFPDQRVINAYLYPNVSHSKEPFSWAMPQSDELRKFMNSRAHWSDSKTDQHLLPVLREMAKNIINQNTNKENNMIIQSTKNPIKLKPKLTSKRVTNAFNKLTNSPIISKTNNKKRKSTTPKKSPPKKKRKTRHSIG